MCPRTRYCAGAPMAEREAAAGAVVVGFKLAGEGLRCGDTVVDGDELQRAQATADRDDGLIVAGGVLCARGRGRR